jgi:outer membrane protein OmpA-like peptidoglycan-associated protein
MKAISNIFKRRWCPCIAILIVLAMFAGCAGNGSLSDTGKGGILGGAGGAALGALIYHGNPLAGALIGAATGALTGGLVGHFMDDRKKDLEKALAPQINAGEIELQILKDHSLLVTSTKQTAFAPGSSVVSQGFIPTIQAIANVMKRYGKTTVAVIGHPDATGTKEEKERLAEQRAEAVRNMFLGMGVEPVLVTAADNPKSNYLDGRVELVIHPLVSQ